MLKEKVIFCWSGGKDSAMALNRLKPGEKIYRPMEITHPGDSNPTYVHPGSPRQTKGFWFCDLLPA